MVIKLLGFLLQMLSFAWKTSECKKIHEKLKWNLKRKFSQSEVLKHVSIFPDISSFKQRLRKSETSINATSTLSFTI